MRQTGACLSTSDRAILSLRGWTCQQFPVGLADGSQHRNSIGRRSMTDVSAAESNPLDILRHFWTDEGTELGEAMFCRLHRQFPARTRQDEATVHAAIRPNVARRSCQLLFALTTPLNPALVSPGDCVWKNTHHKPSCRSARQSHRRVTWHFAGDAALPLSQRDEDAVLPFFLLAAFLMRHQYLPRLRRPVTL